MANWHRDQQRRRVVPLDEFIASRLRTDAPEAAAEAQDEERRLLEAFRELPDERQQLIVLKFVEKLSNQEIGAIMERSEGAIKSLYHRTLLTLREAMLRHEAPETPETEDTQRRPSRRERRRGDAE